MQTRERKTCKYYVPVLNDAFSCPLRAWIPLKDVFLYSEEAPVIVKNKKRGNLDDCMYEVETYIKNASEKYGGFEYAPPRTLLDPKREEEQIRILYPKVS